MSFLFQEIFVNGKLEVFVESMMAGEGGVKEVAVSNTCAHSSSWQDTNNCADSIAQSIQSTLPIWADERFNLACNRSRPMSLLFAVSPQSAQSLGIPDNIADDKTREYLKAAKNLWWTYQTRRRWQRLEGGGPTIVAGPCQGKVWGSPTGHQGPVVEIGLLMLWVVR